jgi:hypothetical protein
MSKFLNLLLLYLFLYAGIPSPLIDFVSKVKKVDKVDGADSSQTKLIKLEFLIPQKTRIKVLSKSLSL